MPQDSDNKVLRTGAVRWMKRAVAVLLLPLFIGVVNLHAKSPVISEDQVKAVYLFNLTGFVSWPDSAFVSSEAPLRIGVSGVERVNSFIDYIRMAVEGETSQQRTIVIEHLPLSADPSGFHMVFITDSPEDKVHELLEAVKGQPILTVGESDGFCRRGGMINLLRRGKRIGLEVNIDAAKTSQLQVSSKLLRIATIVLPEDGNGGDR